MRTARESPSMMHASSRRLIAWGMNASGAVIFDMDGLLIDTEPIWRRIEMEVFAQLGLHLTEADCLETMGIRIAQVVDGWYRRHPWAGPAPAEVTRQIVAAVTDHILTAGEPMPGVLQAMETTRAAGLPIAIASSSGEGLIKAVMQRLGLTRFVTAIFSAEDDPEGKPHPAVYLRAAAGLGVPPERCLAIEDSPNGVVSARAAGMTCIVVPDPHVALDPRLDLADIRLASLTEFTPALLHSLLAGNRTGAH